MRIGLRAGCSGAAGWVQWGCRLGASCYGGAFPMKDEIAAELSTVIAPSSEHSMMCSKEYLPGVAGASAAGASAVLSSGRVHAYIQIRPGMHAVCRHPLCMRISCVSRAYLVRISCVSQARSPKCPSLQP